MNKKTKFLIIIISLAIIIGLIFGIMAIYRFCVIQNIFKKVDENIGIDNYYLKTTLINQKGEEKVTEAYYKEGIGKNIASNSIYTWTDGENAYMVDETSKELYVLDIEDDETSIGLVSNTMFASLIPGYNKTVFERFLMACNLKIKIKSEKIENNKYYKIENVENEAIKTIWISKDRKNPVKSQIEFSNGEKLEYKYELKFLATKLKNIELPDTSRYKVINYKTGETIIEKEETSENSNIEENTNTAINNTTSGNIETSTNEMIQ